MLLKTLGTSVINSPMSPFSLSLVELSVSFQCLNQPERNLHLVRDCDKSYEKHVNIIYSKTIRFFKSIQFQISVALAHKQTQIYWILSKASTVQWLDIKN